MIQKAETNSNIQNKFRNKTPLGDCHVSRSEKRQIYRQTVICFVCFVIIRLLTLDFITVIIIHRQIERTTLKLFLRLIICWMPSSFSRFRNIWQIPCTSDIEQSSWKSKCNVTANSLHERTPESGAPSNVGPSGNCTNMTEKEEIRRFGTTTRTTRIAIVE